MARYETLSARARKASFSYQRPDMALERKESLSKTLAAKRSLKGKIIQRTGKSPEYWEQARMVCYPNFSWVTLNKLFSQLAS